MSEGAAVRRLLYVEDNGDNLYMLQLWFDVLGGYEILSARDGAAGIAMAAAERPDLILMDLNLPQIDGWEATRRLKADPATRDIPIIALSAHAMAGDREKALATGCDDFDSKPIEFDRLLAKIEQALTAKRKRVGLGVVNRRGRRKIRHRRRQTRVSLGDGAEATAGKKVSVHYTGWLYSNGTKGAKFDSSLDRGPALALQLA